MEEILKELNQEVQNGEEDKVKELIQKAVDQGIPVIEILEKGLRSAMEEVGAKFEALEIFLPEMMASADAMKAGVAILRPHLEAAGSQEEGRGIIYVGTVEGDIHDIGKNIVKIMLEGVGYEVVDLGFNVPTLNFVERVQQSPPNVLGMSALMTSTMVHMPRVIQFLKDRGIRDKLKVIVGGAPVLPDWAKEIGADGYGENAAEAISLVKEIVK